MLGIEDQRAIGAVEPGADPGISERQPRGNGGNSKTVRGDFGEVEIETPRDRNGSLEPKIVAKRHSIHSTSFAAPISCAPLLPQTGEQLAFGFLHPLCILRVAVRSRLGLQVHPWRCVALVQAPLPAEPGGSLCQITKSYELAARTTIEVFEEPPGAWTAAYRTRL